MVLTVAIFATEIFVSVALKLLLGMPSSALYEQTQHAGK